MPWPPTGWRAPSPSWWRPPGSSSRSSLPIQSSYRSWRDLRAFLWTMCLELHRTPVDLAAVVREQVLALRVAHPHRTVHLELPVDGPCEAPCEAPVPVVADAERIGQVVTNYVTNALKYSQGDQPVAIQVARDAAWVRVSVEDHGPGLPTSEQERIWGRFYQAKGLRVQSGSGTGLGLGLHICKAIIEGHGGKVGVESEVGKGSTFWFTLLLADGSS